MRKILKFFLCSMIIGIFFIVQMPVIYAADYYASVDSTSGDTLVKSLSSIINNGAYDVGYAGLWDAYKTTDCRPGTNIVWDMYSNEEYDVVTGHSGSYTQEGDMYNREHSVPQSWFGERSPMKADLFHVYPTDGKVNGMRSSYVYGETDSPTYTSKNGSKLGASSFSGYSGTVFEPIDEYKGDFARTYFYMAIRYYDQLGTWTAGEAQKVFQDTYPYLTTYAVNLFTKWNALDPVSEKETTRNDAVYSIQKNRNPFIDHPEYISQIWESEYNQEQINQAKVNQVISLIDLISNDVTFTDEGAIDNARLAYNELTADEMALVTNYSKLSMAETTLQVLEQQDFLALATLASFKISYNSALHPTDVDVRFGGVISSGSYHEDASYGVLVTQDSVENVSGLYKMTSLQEFKDAYPNFKSMETTPSKDGNNYQFAWVVNDMEGNYSTTLTAYIYMEYKGSLYIATAKSYSVETLASYYYVHRDELGLTLEQCEVIKKLIPAGVIGEDLPGDVMQDFWS